MESDHSSHEHHHDHGDHHDHHDHDGHEHHHHGAGGVHLHVDPAEVIRNKRRRFYFALGSVLTALLVAAQIYVGYTAHSVALLTDALHNLTDLTGMLLAFTAMVLVMRAPTKRRTFGYQKFSLLAAFFNQILLLASTLFTLEKAFGRLFSTREVESRPMLIAAAAGIVINVAIAMFLFSDRKASIHSRSAVAHMLGDAGLAFCVVLSAILIGATGWHIVDPLTSIGMSIFIVYRTWPIVGETMNLVMDSVPSEIDHESVEAYLRSIDNVVDLHELHIWGVSDTSQALTVHLVFKPEYTFSEAARWHCVDDLRHKFGLEQITIQDEYGDVDHQCYMAPAI